MFSQIIDLIPSNIDTSKAVIIGIFTNVLTVVMLASLRFMGYDYYVKIARIYHFNIFINLQTDFWQNSVPIH